MSTTKRASKKVIVDVTEDQAQTAAKDYTAAHNQLSLLEAKMNGEIDNVKAGYTEKIAVQREAMEEPALILSVFAFEQRKKWLPKKSYDFLHAVIGFRTGNPEVIKAKKFSWEAVVELMKKNKVFKGFLRTKEEVNKEAILAEKNEAILNQLKEEAYLSVGQTEAFFITPKVEAV